MIPARGPQTVLHIHFGTITQDVFYVGYSCSETQCGTGASRVSPVLVHAKASL